MRLSEHGRSLFASRSRSAKAASAGALATAARSAGPEVRVPPETEGIATVAIEHLEGRMFLSSSPAGAVFVATNHNNTLATNPDEPANQVVMYHRSSGGALSVVGTFDTGGQGSGPSIRFAGDGLGSAHSVQLSENKKFLFVANAGSDNLTVFRVSKNGLKITDIESTPQFPNSVTQDGDRVYVLSNNDGVGAISGYRLSGNGTLKPIANSTRTLNANQDPDRPDTLFNPTQVSFTPDGRKLVVTIKDGPAAGAIPGVTPTGPGRILVFGVNDDRPSSSFTQTNLNNEGPFGFSFDGRGNILTSLFVGGPGLTGSAGSFRINNNNTLTAISRNVPNGQLDTCWLENNGKFAYGANYTSGNISSYRIGDNGSLTLHQAVAGTTVHPGNIQGSTPLDIRVNPNGDFLYDVLPGSGKVAGWRINSNGTLTKVGEFGGLPSTINGDVAPIEYGPGGSPAGIDILDYKGKGNDKDNGRDDDSPPPEDLDVIYVQSNSYEKNKNAILAYVHDPVTGDLVLHEDGPFFTKGTGYFNVDDRIGPDDSDQEIIVSPDRRFLFTVNQGSDTVSVFRILADGGLKLVPGAPFKSGGDQPVSLGLSGDTLVVVNKGSQEPGSTDGTLPNYTTFKVRDDGKLKKIKNSTVTAPPGSSPTQALISNDGRFVFGENFLAHPFSPPLAPFVPAFGAELESFSITSEGTLTRNMAPIQSPIPGDPNRYILGLQTHPTQNILYTGFVVGNKLGVFTYDENGVLDFESSINLTGAGVCWIVISPDAKRLYATNFATNSVAVVNIEDPLHPVEIQDFQLNNTGPLHPADPPSAAIYQTVAFQLAIDPDGQTLYVLDHEQSPDNSYPEGNALHVLHIGANGLVSEPGDPTYFPEDLVPAGAHPMGVVAL